MACAILDAMQPNQMPQPVNPHQDFSIDYLNQLDPNHKKVGGPSPKVMIGAIVVGVLALAFFAFTILSGSSSTSSDRLTAINLRLQTLQALSKAQHKKLRDNDLQATDGNLAIYLTNTLRDIEKPATAANIDLKKVTKEKQAAETAYKTKLDTTFSDASLNVQLDATYARQMAYELSLLKSQMTKLKSSSSSKSAKEFVDTSTASLDTIIKDFESFSSAT